jgi:hypothetical protein
MAVKPIVTRRLYMGGATGYKTGGGRIICVSVSGIQSGGHVWAWPLMDRDRRFRRQPKLRPSGAQWNSCQYFAKRRRRDVVKDVLWTKESKSRLEGLGIGA